MTFQRKIKCVLFVLGLFFCIISFSVPMYSSASEIDTEENVGYAGTTSEFIEWLDNNKTVGGTLYLTQDIVIDRNMDYLGGIFHTQMKPVTIVTGPYSLYIQAEVCMDICYMLTIQGEGGSKGVIQVAPGGYLSISMLTIKAEDGFAVVQADGGALSMGTDDHAPNMEGAVHFSQTPVLRDFTTNIPVVVMNREDGYQDNMLPVDGRVLVNYMGEDILITQEVRWKPEDVMESLDNKERTFVQGNYCGVLKDEALPEIDISQCADQTSLQALVVFAENDIAFLECSWMAFSWGGYQVLLECMYPQGASKLMLYSSRDAGETWILEEEEDSLEGYDSHTFVLNIEDWNPYAYKYCVEYQGKIYDSDAIILTENERVKSLEIEGNRGGGTEILPPDKEPDQPPYQEETDGSKDSSEQGGTTTNDGLSQQEPGNSHLAQSGPDKMYVSKNKMLPKTGLSGARTNEETLETPGNIIAEASNGVSKDVPGSGIVNETPRESVAGETQAVSPGKNGFGIQIAVGAAIMVLVLAGCIAVPLLYAKHKSQPSGEKR